jgi:CubicO group peptidase (beta-lactamase class C family)
MQLVKFIIISLLINTTSCASTNTTSKYNFDKKFSAFNSAGNGPGLIVGVYRNDSIVFEKGYGTYDGKNKIDASTNFRLASVSKQFTAYAVAILEDRKKINRNDSILKYFPELPKTYQKIKIKHLIHHMSGLKDYMSLCKSDKKVYNSDVIKLLAKTPKLDFRPGSKYQYSNSGYVILASLVERVSGKTFGKFLEEDIFNPLGMVSSTVFGEDVEIENRAYGVGRYPYFKKADYTSCNFIYGDGGIYASARDLSKWFRAYTTNPLVSKQTLKRMLSKSKTDSGKEVNYSYGLIPEDSFMNQRMIFHNGSWVGFRTQVSYFPKSDTLFVLLSNYIGTSIWSSFADIASEVLD